MNEVDRLWGAIARLRRNQPRNDDTQLVCEELERRLKAEATARIIEVANRVANAPLSSSQVANTANKPKRDRREYQRKLMRSRRAAARQGGAKA